MEQDNFIWLQNWYQSHCDGDWEHQNGVRLNTIDNPGWSLTISLQDTELEGKKFKNLEINRSDSNWLFCAVRNNRFEGRCGCNNLEEILHIFRSWAGMAGLAH